jgi:diguanylate cyclase (GGDEF)-like protein
MAATDLHTLLSVAAAEVAVEAWREQAEQDRLTGLKNLRGMEADLLAFVDTGAPFSVTSIDLDGLKRINDSQGHEAGDAYLRDFGGVLRVALAERGGTAYRHAGDEFTGALRVEDGDLHEVLLQLSQRDGVAPFSWGVSTSPDDGTGIDDLLKTADRRMYDMKRQRKEALAAEVSKEKGVDNI